MITQEATITRIIEEGKTIQDDGTQEYQHLELQLIDDDQKVLEIIRNQAPFSRWTAYHAGEQVIITQQPDNTWIITDYLRRPALFQLSLLFAVLVIAVGRWWGIRSLLSLAISFAIIFGMILPAIMSGSNPLLITLLGSALIIPFTFYLSHGFNKKTHVAIAGTLISLLLAGLLAVAFVDQAHLTGFASEEAGFLSVLTSNSIDLRGLLLAGIIISLLGTLDDITVSQSSFVEQLKESNPKISFKELFSRAMKVGQDHISSMVNTLILVYAGASLPLLLLFLDANATPDQILNLEIVADEVVRTLVGSIGIVLAAPITTLLATSIFIKPKNVTGSTK
ncbi:MAG: YibE/F family protein [Candidatus Paceibacterota bacterium]